MHVQTESGKVLPSLPAPPTGGLSYAPEETFLHVPRPSLLTISPESYCPCQFVCGLIQTGAGKMVS
jgi:hypothetical protein